MKPIVLLLAMLAIPSSADAAVLKSASATPGSYIVVLKVGLGRMPTESVVVGPDLGDVALDMALVYGGTVGFVYRNALQGFSIRLPADRAEALASDWRVDFVEEDGVMTVDAVQNRATWGLDRIDQRSLPLSGSYSYLTTGAGVTAYVIDTGIRLTHREFGGRAVAGFGSAGDCNGHGTHVAGTIGGATYGVAKGVTLVAVRVFGCTGSTETSRVVAGVDWVTGHHQPGSPAVANMSLGGPPSKALDSAVRRSIDDGVAYAVAAGNGNGHGAAIDACSRSPARVEEAMTISATTKTDTRVSWANYGRCVDWFAPGYGITSAWSTSNTATATINGTSMATPHAAGTAALFLETYPLASPAEVRQVLFDSTTKGKVKSARSANSHLLFTRALPDGLAGTP